jgi:O-antigen ligase
MFLRKLVLIFMAMVVFIQPWGSGAFEMISIGPLGLMSILGILAFLFAVGYLLFGVQGLGKAAVPIDASVAWLGVFVALNLASIGWADVPGRAISNSLTLIQVFVFVWLLAFLRLEQRGFDTILHAYVLGSIIVAFWSAYEIFVVGSDVGSVGRVEAFNRDANYTAYTLVVALPMAYYLANRGGIGFLRWVYFAFIPAGIFVLIFTGSRGMTVAMVAWLALFLWFLLTSRSAPGSRGSQAAVVLSTALVLGGSAFVVLAFSDLAEHQIQRLMTITDPMGSDFGNRLYIWIAGFQVFLQNLLLGVGTGGFAAAIIPYFEGDVYIFSFIDRGAASHNTYLNIAVTTGIVGLAVFGVMLFTLVKSALRANPPEKLLFLSLMLISLVAGLSLHLDDRRLFYLALFAQATVYPTRTGARRPVSGIVIVPTDRRLPNDGHTRDSKS